MSLYETLEHRVMAKFSHGAIAILAERSQTTPEKECSLWERSQALAELIPNGLVIFSRFRPMSFRAE
jgi:hypothetical protein